MLNKILSFGKKSDGFYLELDESQKNQTAAAKAEIQSQPTTEAKPEKPEATASVESEQPQPEVKSAPPKSAKAKSQNGKAPAPKAKPTPANSGASSWEQPFWVKVMYKNSNNGSNGKAAPANTFATDYLMPTVSKSRRRPGPSLNKFKDMANKAKTPKG